MSSTARSSSRRTRKRRDLTLNSPFAPGTPSTPSRRRRGKGKSGSLASPYATAGLPSLPTTPIDGRRHKRGFLSSRGGTPATATSRGPAVDFAHGRAGTPLAMQTVRSFGSTAGGGDGPSGGGPVSMFDTSDSDGDYTAGLGTKSAGDGHPLAMDKVEVKKLMLPYLDQLEYVRLQLRKRGMDGPGASRADGALLSHLSGTSRTATTPGPAAGRHRKAVQAATAVASGRAPKDMTVDDAVRLAKTMGVEFDANGRAFTAGAGSGGAAARSQSRPDYTTMATQMDAEVDAEVVRATTAGPASRAGSPIRSRSSARDRVRSRGQLGRLSPTIGTAPPPGVRVGSSGGMRPHGGTPLRSNLAVRFGTATKSLAVTGGELHPTDSMVFTPDQLGPSAIPGDARGRGIMGDSPSPTSPGMPYGRAGGGSPTPLGGRPRYGFDSRPGTAVTAGSVAPVYSDDDLGLASRGVSPEPSGEAVGGTGRRGSTGLPPRWTESRGDDAADAAGATRQRSPGDPPSVFGSASRSRKKRRLFVTPLSLGARMTTPAASSRRGSMSSTLASAAGGDDSVKAPRVMRLAASPTKPGSRGAQPGAFHRRKLPPPSPLPPRPGTAESHLSLTSVQSSELGFGDDFQFGKSAITAAGMYKPPTAAAPGSLADPTPENRAVGSATGVWLPDSEIERKVGEDTTTCLETYPAYLDVLDAQDPGARCVLFYLLRLWLWLWLWLLRSHSPLCCVWVAAGMCRNSGRRRGCFASLRRRTTHGTPTNYARHVCNRRSATRPMQTPPATTDRFELAVTPRQMTTVQRSGY